MGRCVLKSFIFRDVCTEYTIPYVVTLQVRVVEEAIKYIDELHLALFRRAPILAGESHYIRTFFAVISYSSLHGLTWLVNRLWASTWPESSTERKLPYSKRGALRKDYKDPWMSLVLTRPSQPYVVWTIVYSLPFKLSVNKYVKTFYRQADYEAAHTLCYSCFCEQSRQNVVCVCV